MKDEVAEKIFDLLRELQKEVSQCEMSLKSHLDSSEIRVANYDTSIINIKARLQSLDETVKKLNAFKSDLEGQVKGWERFKTSLGWLIGILGTILGFYLGFKK